MNIAVVGFLSPAALVLVVSDSALKIEEIGEGWAGLKGLVEGLQAIDVVSEEDFVKLRLAVEIRLFCGAEDA
jgi:hypothetical protein